jgi:hypothetical protein
MDDETIAVKVHYVPWDETLTIKCNAKTTTIYQLKELCSHEFGLNKMFFQPDGVQLIFGGRVQSDDVTFSDVKIENNDTVHLIDNLRGD